tara:strand:+ start:428 stop:676 length:249 start_codon:yes stop_codon:yes gene_type:complete
MNEFERNSGHLMSAGYVFAMANIMDGCVAGYPACLMPMWVRKEDRSNTDTVRAILGSEPKVGQNPEVVLERSKIANLVLEQM